jgi:Leucine-rich repeat (LRR) protein/ribosomal protein L35AE/L33A
MLKKTYLLWLFGLALLSPNLAAQTDCDNVSQIPTAECDALLALYDSTNGEGWTDNKKWLTNNKPCGWSGVRCEDKHVTYLDLANNQLNGFLPTDLGNLTGLKGFELHSNQLNGIIPPELGQLADLETLYLYSNQFSGTIPPELGGLSNLEYLRLNENDLCGDIPVELMALTNILGLSLDNNHLTASDPDLITWLDQHSPGWDTTQTDCPVGTTLQFSSATYSVDEDAGQVTITVTRVDGSQGAVSVDYATSDDTATAGSDYTESTGTLSWSDGDTSDKTFTVVILDDDTYEGDETVNLTLSNVAGDATIGDPGTAALIIVDDEMQGSTLQFSSDNYSVNENGGSATITVTRAGGSQGTVSVDYATSDDSATAGSDYTETSGTLDWANGDIADKTFTISIIDDDDSENNETLIVSLNNPVGAVLGSPDTAVLTIKDDEAPVTNCAEVTKIPVEECEALVALYESTDGGHWTDNTKWNVTDNPCKWFGVRCEGGHVTWLFLENNRLSGSLPTGLDALSELKGFELHTNQLNGIIPPDLGNLANLESLYLYSNQLSGSIPPELGDLDKLEYLRLHDNKLCGVPPESLMNLASLLPAQLLGLSLDDNHLTPPDDPIFRAWLEALNPGWEDSQTDCPESGTVQFSSATYSVDEDGVSVEITVERVDASDGAISVECISFDESATGGDDYSAVFETLNWGDGDASDKTFTVDINDDTIFEGDETFGLTLFEATGGATIGEPSTTVVTIIDDEKPGTLQFKKAKYEVNENGGSVEITVTRINGSDGAISVDYATSDGTAMAGEDYGASSGTLNWSHGDASDKTFTVDILDDTIFEDDDETFNLTLTNATGGATIGEPRTAVVTIIDNDEPGTVQFSSATYSVGEGDGAVTITVTRVGGSDGAISVDYATSDGTAMAGEDYGASSGTLNWSHGDASDKTFTVDILDDTIFEDDDETFNLTLTNATGGATIGDPSTAVVTIIDDDKKPGTLQFSEAASSVYENEVLVEITVTRVGGSDGAVSVDYSSSDGTATAEDDYTAVSGTLSWSDGDANDKTFFVTIIDDTIPEDDETFILTLSNATGDATIGSPDTAEVTIIDDGSPGTLQFSEDTYSVNEADGTVTLTVTRLNGSDGAISVKCKSSDGTATAGEDYTKTTETLEWDDGDTDDKICTVPIIVDSDVEEDETFSMKLKNATGGATIGKPDTAVVTIIDGGLPGTVQFSSDTYSVNEADGTVTLTVTRLNGSDGAISVKCKSSDGTATAGEDYTKTTETLEWDDGDTDDKICTVPIIDDSDVEEDETFSLSLKNATGGATIGKPDTAVVTIIDGGLPGTVQFSSDTYSVNEADGTVTLTVTRLNGSNGAVSVDYATSDGTAMAGDDYTAVSGTLNWSDGDASDKTFTVDINDDTDVEGDETFNLTLTNATGGATIGDPSTAEVTIVDKPVNHGTLQFSPATYSVNEDGVSVEITVTRVNGSNGAVSVNYSSSDGTATAGDDYTAVSGTLNWKDGNSNDKKITVSITNDNDVEGDETFNLTLTNATGGAIIGDQDTAVVTIVDKNSGTLQFEKAKYEVNENGGSVEITVTRVDGSDGAVSVDYATSDGTAKAGKDYTAVSGTLNWEDGNSSDKAITVTITDDSIYEDDEKFSLKLSNPTGGATIGTPKTTVVTIVDNEPKPPAGVLQFSSATYSVNENGGTVNITVTRAESSDGAISVECKSSNGSATAGEDYNAVSKTLNWADGDDSDKTFTAYIIDDADVEGNETFSLTLSNPTGGATIGDPNTAVVTIVDDEVTPVHGTLQFASAAYSVGENGPSVTITVSRVNGSDSAVSVDYDTSDETATAGSDYTQTSGTLNWNDKDSADKSFTINITDDSTPEDDETFIVTLSNATNGAELGTPNTAVVTIIDDDDSTIFDCATVTEITTPECEALVAVYNSTNGEQWKNNTGWLETNTPCSWHGIQCKNGHVTRLYLQYNQLTGSIPSAIEGLSYLEVLNMRNNALCGDIPVELMNLVHLWALSLDNNHLTASDSGLIEWLNNLNPGWDASQTSCPVVRNTVQFKTAAYNVTENGGQVTVAVSRTGNSDGAVSVDYATNNGTATAGSDYTQASGTLNWDDKDFADKSFTINITDDSAQEGNETFIVILSNVTGDAELGAPNTAVVTIIDNDSTSFNCATVTEITTPECEALVAVYNSANGGQWNNNTGWLETDTPCSWHGIQCKNGHVTRLYLQYNQLTGSIPSAIEGLSYLEVLNMRNNALCGDIPVELMNLVHLWALSLDNNHLTASDSGLIEWLNQLNPGWDASQTPCQPTEENTVQFTAATYNVAEDGGQATIAVSRAGSDNGAISVDYATSDDTATTNACFSDYTAAAGTLNWANGDSANKTITVNIADDNRLESDETLIISLNNPTGGAGLGTPDTAVLTIIDNESPSFDCTAVTGIPTAECNALVSLYDHAGGDQWKDNTGWKTTNTPCDWYGVECKNGHVTRLKLQYNQLKGSISEMIGNLSELEVLTLNNNLLRGNIPSTIGDLNNLWNLNLANNQLSCQIPTEMGNLSNLQNLSLENNDLSADIPASLMNLNNLSKLSLDSNHLEAHDTALIAWLNAHNPGWETTQTPLETEDDIIIDFGSANGIWIQIDGCQWIQLHDVTAESMITADLDGNDQDEVIIDFGPGHGIWVRMNNSSWDQLDENSPESMVSGDLDGNDQDDIIIDFGDSISVWMNNDGWVDLDTSLSSENMVTGDINGDGQDEIIIDFGTGNGISIWMYDGTWVSLHDSSSENMVTGDVDGNGQDDVIIDFGAGQRIFAWMNNSEWVELHSFLSESMVTGDVDGNGQDELIVDFGAAYGIWMQMNNDEWVQLHTVSPKSMVVINDINGHADIIVDFGDCYGIWLWKNNSDWIQLHSVSANSIAVGDVDELHDMSGSPVSSDGGTAQLPTFVPGYLPLP